MSLHLAVNTSHKQAEVALLKDNQLVANKMWTRAKSHSEVITLAVSEILKDSGHTLSDLEGLYCVNGPGSFTGIRVGVNFCKTLAFSLRIDVATINALDLQLSSTVEQSGHVLSVIDAQKNSVFASLFDFSGNSQKSVFENQVISFDELPGLITQPAVVVGDGLDHAVGFIPKSLTGLLTFSQSTNHQSFQDHFKNGENEKVKWISWDQIHPVYIKASAPEEKLNPTTLKL